MYICLCNGITDREIRQCAQSGACSMSELECSLGVGVSCGRCRDAAAAILQEQGFSRSARAVNQTRS